MLPTDSLSIYSNCQPAAVECPHQLFSTSPSGLSALPDRLERKKGSDNPPPFSISTSTWILIGISLIFPLWLLIAGLRYAWQETERHMKGPIPDEMQQAKISMQAPELPFKKKVSLLSEMISEYWTAAPRSGLSFLQMLFPCYTENEVQKRWTASEEKVVLSFLSSSIDHFSQDEIVRLPPDIRTTLSDPTQHQPLSEALSLLK